MPNVSDLAIKTEWAKHKTIRQIAKALGVSKSWIHQRLHQLGLKPWGTRFAKGYQVRCADGHQVASLGEATVDEFLDAYRIRHWVHWRIQGTGILADFYLPDLGLCMEYAGMQGYPEYDIRLAEKRQLYAQWNIPVVIITPETPLDAALLQEFVRVVQEAQRRNAEDHAILRR